MKRGQVDVTGADIGTVLAQLNNLDQCLIERVRFRRYQTELVFDILRLLDRDGSLLPRTEQRKTRLVFRAVREVRFANGLNQQQLDEPGQMHWGVNEVAWVDLVPNSALAHKYAGHLGGPHHVAFLWEGPPDDADGRRIDVVASELVVESDVAVGSSTEGLVE